MYIINGIHFNSIEQTICHEEKTILLTPKANQLLLFMVQHPNQTLSREEILTSVWSRDFVSDHSLTQAVSDLRKALSELGTEYKKLIVTRPKTGYVLEADVSRIEGTTPHSGKPSSNVISKSTTFKWAFVSFLTLLLFAVLMAFFNWFPEKTNSKATINPYNVAFVTFSSPDKYQHLAFGLSDLINYRINQQGRYRSSLLYEQDNDLSERAALVMSGSITEENHSPVLEFYIYDNISDKKLFSRKYSLDDSVIVLVAQNILTDLEAVMEMSFDHAIIDKLDRQYPRDSKTFNLMHQAHYASSIITTRSLYSAIKLYDKVLKQDPNLEIAAAERLISAKILNSIQPFAIPDNELKEMYDSLLSIRDELHAPIYYEALAVCFFDRDDLSNTKTLLAKAVNIRESWFSNIIAGKIAEVEGKTYLAATSYKRAYAMKPDESTLRVINTLLFVTDLSELNLP
ncbi:hypothetical protein HJ057_04200 [Vibrio parahaemolyticus]|uniref:winged helix-turn-helix domain-containing protein n=3 Tax=Vibrio parahaemolyticus TaxID=670 RepID=UPI000B79215A|nr:winged helix-turn-helix domain-containing protein [Vibrio parahaemolyticus]ELY5143061.1 winged helix-turn-helix domain-containing protein [Vibrio vulnificus]EHH1173966.1 hypothetical protein [Vibrio parahaemolyticus]EIO5095940.1 winged helix-turn-helix domain-containing protein [Vibrio parahaemolyticus]MBE4324136.1 hypothetical protein [Vibrio parahaemolyticus]MBE4445859.1 hypothetical protein [Vibrio parahaemolyticus]